MYLTTSDSPIDNPLGQVLRLPCKFIKGESDASAIVIQAIAQELKQASRNVLPAIVRQTTQDKYEVILNAQIVEASRQAKLDFVWCIVVNDSMEAQLQVEIGKVVKVNLNTASEKDIDSFFEFIRTKESSFSKVQPKSVAKAIVDYRQKTRLKDLNVLTKLKCGIGKTKLPLLLPYLVFS